MIVRKGPPVQWLVTVLLFLYPVVALAVQNAGNAILFLLLVIAAVALALSARPDNVSFRVLCKNYWPLHLAMMSACLAVLLNQMWSGHFAFKFYDRGVRLAMFPFVFWVLFFVPFKYMKLLQWSFVVAVFVATVKAYIFTKGGHIRDGNIGFLSIIAYSDITMLVGMLCLTSLADVKAKNKLIFCILILASMAGAYTSVLTATRGGWLVVPFLLIFFFGFSGSTVRQKCTWLGMLVVVPILMFSLNQEALSRLDNTQSDLISYSQGEGKSTSTGIRLQLWGAALHLFARAPVFGIGRENYESSIKEMADKHEVTRELTNLAHSHNEILFNMAISGLFGLLSTLSLYLVPAYFFARELRNKSADVRIAAKSGCVLVIGFFAFGLTDLMFFWPVLCGYYALMVSVFLVAIIKAKNEEGRVPSP